MAEILGGYWQILDRSGKKIILLLPLLDRPTTPAKADCFICVATSTLGNAGVNKGLRKPSQIRRTNHGNDNQGCSRSSSPVTLNLSCHAIEKHYLNNKPLTGLLPPKWPKVLSCLAETRLLDGSNYFEFVDALCRCSKINFI